MFGRLPEALSLIACASATYASLWLLSAPPQPSSGAAGAARPCPPAAAGSAGARPTGRGRPSPAAIPAITRHVQLPPLSRLDHEFLAEPSGTPRYHGLDNIRREVLRGAQRLTIVAARTCRERQRRDPPAIDPATVKLALDLNATIDRVSIAALRQLTVVGGAPLDEPLRACVEDEVRRALPWSPAHEGEPMSTVRRRRPVFADFSGDVTVTTRLGRCESCEGP
jgi:hypothetical protein